MVYCAGTRNGQPFIVRGKRGKRYPLGWAFTFAEWIIECDCLPPSYVSDSGHDVLRSTLPAALTWLVERTAARLATQEQEAAQTRETLAELRGMLEEEVGG